MFSFFFSPPRFCYLLFHFFLSLFSSSLHFQFYNALFQLYNALSCSFLVVLFIPLQTIVSSFFQFCCCSFLCRVIIRSSSMLLQFSCFSFHSFLPLCTFNFIVLFFNFINCSFLFFFGVVVHSSPNYIACIVCSFSNSCCCSFLCRVIICSSSMLQRFTPLQHYLLSLFHNIVAHYNLVYSFPSMCCGSF
jgi:hypothetical protein